MNGIETQSNSNSVDAGDRMVVPIGINLANPATRTKNPLPGALAYDSGLDILYYGNNSTWIPSGATSIHNVLAPIAATDDNGIIFNDGLDTVRLEFADATHNGIVSHAAQTYGGTKSFADGVLTNTLDTIGATTMTIGTTATQLDFTTTDIANFRGGIGSTVTIGLNAGPTGGGSIHIGSSAGQNDTSINSIFIGSSAGINNVTGGNLGIGALALSGANAGVGLTAVGSRAFLRIQEEI
jgi:hypothetical protein